MRHAAGDRVMDRYEVLEVISQGGMGCLYKARDLHFTSRTVALKQMLDEVGEAEREIVARYFHEEAELLSRIKHNNVPSVVDRFICDGIPYVAMEFVEGTPLDTVLRDGPMAAPRVVNYAIQIAEVLAYLHGMTPPLLHRDIKPGNVIVRRERDEVVLIDFGLAKQTAATESRTLVGTLGYAPLEQVQGHPDNRSDIYALGATMYHLLTGRGPEPFSIPSIRSVKADVHPMLAEVVDKAVAEVNSRYQAVEPMLQDLKQVQAELAGRSSLPLRLPPSVPDLPLPRTVPVRPLPIGLLAAGVLLVLCLGLGAWQLTRTAPPAAPSPSPTVVAVAATPTPEVSATPIETATPAATATPTPTPEMATPTPQPTPTPAPAATPTQIVVSPPTGNLQESLFPDLLARPSDWTVDPVRENGALVVLHWRQGIPQQVSFRLENLTTAWARVRWGNADFDFSAARGKVLFAVHTGSSILDLSDLMPIGHPQPVQLPATVTIRQTPGGLLVSSGESSGVIPGLQPSSEIDVGFKARPHFAMAPEPAVSLHDLSAQ